MNYVRCYPETHREVKVYAAQHGLSMQEVVSRAVESLMKPAAEAKDDTSSQHPREPVSAISGTKYRRWHDILEYILASGVPKAVAAVTASLTVAKDLAEVKSSTGNPSVRLLRKKRH